MKFAKWGNSLAVRIPAEVVAKLNLGRPGSQIRVTGEHYFQVRSDHGKSNRKAAKIRFTVPDNYVFNAERFMTGKAFLDTNVFVYALVKRVSCRPIPAR